MKVIKNKALFLDRDGVINIDTGYLHKIEDFIFINGVFDFIKYFYNNDYLIFIVTNQSGIIRGYYTEQDFEILTDFMLNEFNKQNIKITKVYYCSCHEDFVENCTCRKPSPEMILQASQEFNINLSESLLVGDRESDIQSGKTAGVKFNYLLTDHFSFEDIINNFELFIKK